MKLPVNYINMDVVFRRIVREEYIKRQDDKCYYCKELLTLKPANKVLNKPINKKYFPKGFFRWPIHLHHNHKTGMTIGAVHNYCNAVLWQYDKE